MSLQMILANTFLWYRKHFHPIGGDTVEESRASYEAMAPKKIPADIEIESVDTDTVKGEWVRPKAGGSRTMLYFHGGGYVIGSPRINRRHCMPLAREAQADLFVQDYRLAPEHPFPAALEDALAAWTWLLDQGHAPERLVISGDSAGGGLSVALLLKLKQRGMALPAAAILLSPWVDLTAASPSYDSNAKRDLLLDRAALTGFADAYLQGQHKVAPLASPLFGDLAGLPPLQIHVGLPEVLLQDSLSLAEKAKAVGVAVELIRQPKSQHVWQIIMPDAPESKASRAAMVRFWHAQVAG